MTQKTVVVLAGPTGPTGTIQGINILAGFTGATGEIAQWLQATGATGPAGTLKKVYNIGPTGLTGGHKNVIIFGFSGSGGATGSVFNPADQSGATLSNGNRTAAFNTASVAASIRGTKSHVSPDTAIYYLELQNIISGSNVSLFGIGTLARTMPGGAAGSAQMAGAGGDGTYYNGAAFFATGAIEPGPNGPGNTTVQIAFQPSTNLIWINVNNQTTNPGWNNATGGVPGDANGRVLEAAMQGVALVPLVWDDPAAANTDTVTIATILSQFKYALPSGCTPWG